MLPAAAYVSALKSIAFCTQGRILSVLLTMPSRADRKAALVDAFTPPSNAELFELTAPEEEEMLYTSPFTMLTVMQLAVCTLLLLS